MTLSKQYLGDSVYVEFKRGMLKLTSFDGIRRTTIYLEGKVYQALVDYVDRMCEAELGAEINASITACCSGVIAVPLPAVEFVRCGELDFKEYCESMEALRKHVGALYDEPLQRPDAAARPAAKSAERLTPREPTDDMRAAAWLLTDIDKYWLCAIWRAMWDAAPDSVADSAESCAAAPSQGAKCAVCNDVGWVMRSYPAQCVCSCRAPKTVTTVTTSPTGDIPRGGSPVSFPPNE